MFSYLQLWNHKADMTVFAIVEHLTCFDSPANTTTLTARFWPAVPHRTPVRPCSKWPPPCALQWNSQNIYPEFCVSIWFLGYWRLNVMDGIISNHKIQNNVIKVLLCFYIWQIPIIAQVNNRIPPSVRSGMLGHDVSERGFIWLKTTSRLSAVI